MSYVRTGIGKLPQLPGVPEELIPKRKPVVLKPPTRSLPTLPASLAPKAAAPVFQLSRFAKAGTKAAPSITVKTVSAQTVASMSPEERAEFDAQSAETQARRAAAARIVEHSGGEAIVIKDTTVPSDSTAAPEGGFFSGKMPLILLGGGAIVAFLLLRRKKSGG